MFTLFLRHKHGNKHSIYTVSKRAVLALVMAASVIPSPALAFNVVIPTSPVPKLLAQVQSIQTDLNPAQETSSSEETLYTHTSASVVATSSVVAEEAVWVKQTKKTSTPKPTLESPVILEGEASYYSLAGCLGCNPLRIMANGERLDDNALTMAIGADKKHLVGYRAKVTNLVTGQSVTVRITDTGGFYQEKYGRRVADLSVATKQAIGMKGGLGQVRVEIF